jgi:arsenate reductase
MAQGWAEHLKGDRVEAFSAGTAPVEVNQRAIKVMAEAGVDISSHTSKHLDELSGIELDYIITVCDSAKEQCPVYPGRTKIIHKSFDDPAGITGTEEQVMTEFRRIRDEIRQFVQTLPGSLSGQ